MKFNNVVLTPADISEQVSGLTSEKYIALDYLGLFQAIFEAQYQTEIKLQAEDLYPLVTREEVDERVGQGLPVIDPALLQVDEEEILPAERKAHLIEGTPGQLHDQIGTVRDQPVFGSLRRQRRHLAIIVDGDDTWVVQPRDSLDLSLEGRDVARTMPHIPRYDLDGHRHLQRLVETGEYIAHPALSEPFVDVVWRDGEIHQLFGPGRRVTGPSIGGRVGLGGC